MSSSKVLKLEGWCSCEGCTAKVNNLMSKTEGIQSKTLDSEKGTITLSINGAVDMTKLVTKMQSKMKKKVTIMPSKDKTEEVNKQLGDAAKSKTTESNTKAETCDNSKLVYAHGHGFASGYAPTPSAPGDRVYAPVYAPELFSEENPSACNIQ